MKLQHELLVNEARRLGFDIEEDTGNDLVASLLYKGQTCRLDHGTPECLLNTDRLEEFDDKSKTKIGLRKLGIPHPRSLVFTEPRIDMTIFLDGHRFFVCKPIDQTEGKGVVLNIKNYKEVEKYWDENKHLSSHFLLEQQFKGYDLRIQVINGELVAACTREPAYITGDGIKSLRSLIIEKQQLIKTQNFSNELVIDQKGEEEIRIRGYDDQSIPKAGERIQLNALANMSQGAEAIDRTDEIHDDYFQWVSQLSEYYNSGYFALDVMTYDHRRDPYVSASVIEINSRPEWLHHTFSSRKTHPMANMVMKAVIDSMG